METESLLRKARNTQELSSSHPTHTSSSRNSEKLTHGGYRSINLNGDIECQSKQGFRVGQLYRYCPNDKCPKFSVYRLPQTTGDNLFLGNISRKQLFVCLERQDQRWVKIAASQMEGWISLPLTFQNDHHIFQSISSYRTFEDTFSRHKFFWEGKVMIGPDTDYFLFTLIIIPVSLLLYIFTVANRFPALCGGLLVVIFLYTVSNNAI